MARKEDMHHSILIVSAARQFEAIVKRSLTGFVTIDGRHSGAMARHSVLEREYDMVVIDGPLPDETGEEFALDVMEKSGSLVLLVIPREVFEDVQERMVDHGVLVLSKPFSRGRLDQSIRFLCALQSRMRQLKTKTLTVEEKMEEIRIVSRAKLLLVEHGQMSEDEAHRFIGKQAMNNGVSRKRIAEQILNGEVFSG